MTSPGRRGTSKAGQSDRRRSPRVAERVPFAITEGRAAVQAESVNLSAAGAYCTLERFIAPMTKLQLDYELPDPAGGGAGGNRRIRIRCTGVVVRTEPVVTSPEAGRYHIAIFFTDLNERDRSAIARFVGQRLARPSPS